MEQRQNLEITGPIVSWIFLTVLGRILRDVRLAILTLTPIGCKATLGTPRLGEQLVLPYLS